MTEQKTAKKELKKVVLIGPVYPYKGGIAHFTGLMSKALSKKFETITISYKMQYPKLLFKKEQRDYSNKTFEVPDAQFLIHTANPFNIWNCAAKIRKMKPDLIILQWWHPYFAPCYQLLLGALRGYKVLFVCHNVLPHERFVMDRFLTKSTLRKADYCIVHSREDEKDLALLLPDMKCLRTVHPTYSAFKLRNISKETAREELGIAKDEKMLLFFGLVRKYKGLKHLIEALPAIVEKQDNLRLFIVGDFGAEKEEYMQLIREKKMEPYIVVRDGYIPDKEVEPYFAAADMNLCPYESATQSGIVQIAFGFGLPVLVTNVGGLPEVVTDGKTGYVVEPQNPTAIAEAVNRYFDENRQEEFCKNVLAQSERFSWDRVPENVEKLWNETI